MVYVGIDPSLKRSAVSYYDPNSNKFVITSFPKTLQVKKGFEEIYSDANLISDEVSKYIYGISNELCVISEIPPPQGQYSPALYAYDSLLIHKLHEQGSVKEFYRVYPNYLGHVHKKRKYAKSESVAMAKEIIERLKTVGAKFYNTSCRFNHDEAESFIFLCRLLVLKGMFVDEISIVEGLAHEKEKLMWRNNYG